MDWLHANDILFNHKAPCWGENFVTWRTTRAVRGIKIGLQKKLFLGNLKASQDWGVFVGGLCQGYVVDAAARKAWWLTMLLLQRSLTHCWGVLGGGVWRCGGTIGRSMGKLIQGLLLLIQLQKSFSTLCLCRAWNFSWTRISQMLWDTHTPSNANLAIELSCALCAGTSDHQRWIISEGQLKRPRKVLAGIQNLVSSSWWRW